jgi:hypothetical protein
MLSMARLKVMLIYMAMMDILWGLIVLHLIRGQTETCQPTTILPTKAKVPRPSTRLMNFKAVLLTLGEV